MDDRPSRVLDHLLPMFELQTLAIVAEQNATDGIRRSDSVVIGHNQFQINPLYQSIKADPDRLVRGGDNNARSQSRCEICDSLQYV